METANDRFKRRTTMVSANAVVAAVAMHFALFAFFPRLTTADMGILDPVLTAVVPPPAPDLPPEPERIQRPLNPVFTDNLDVDPVLPTTNPADYTAEDLAPPPLRTGDEGAAGVREMTPMTVRPRLLNTADVQRALVRAYPPLLRDAGIGGTPTIWFLIDIEGRVLKTELHESSGRDQLDEAALRVADVMRFAPAWNRDRRVEVWVSMPIRFEAKAPTP
jgi:protein TonB